MILYRGLEILLLKCVSVGVGRGTDAFGEVELHRPVEVDCFLFRSENVVWTSG